MDVYILHIIPKGFFFFFFFQAADQKTKGEFTLFWGVNFMAVPKFMMMTF